MCISPCVYDDRAIRFSQVFEVRLFRMFPKIVNRWREGDVVVERNGAGRAETETDIERNRTVPAQKDRERECRVVSGLSERESCFKGWQHTEELETNRAPRT